MKEAELVALDANPTYSGLASLGTGRAAFLAATIPAIMGETPVRKAAIPGDHGLQIAPEA